MLRADISQIATEHLGTNNRRGRGQITQIDDLRVAPQVYPIAWVTGRRYTRGPIPHGTLPFLARHGVGVPPGDDAERKQGADNEAHNQLTVWHTGLLAR